MHETLKKVVGYLDYPGFGKSPEGAGAATVAECLRLMRATLDAPKTVTYRVTWQTNGIDHVFESSDYNAAADMLADHGRPTNHALLHRVNVELMASHDGTRPYVAHHDYRYISGEYQMTEAQKRETT
jgi:hypothetical protein